MSEDLGVFDKSLGGLWTALVTPFTQDGIDWTSLEGLVQRQLSAGVTGIMVAGTTGETPTLRDTEYTALMQQVVSWTQGRMRVFAGVGSYATAQALERLVQAEAAGVDGLLVVTPYYNKPSQAGLYAHYSALAQRTQLPMMLYSVPSRCGVRIEIDTLCRLYEAFPHACMLKDCTQDTLRFSRLYAALGDAFGLFFGDDLMSLPFFALGAKGLVSVAANAFPVHLKVLVDACRGTDPDLARKSYHRLRPLLEALVLETNPVPIKGLLAHLGLIGENRLRLPLMPATPQTLERMVEASQRIEI